MEPLELSNARGSRAVVRRRGAILSQLHVRDREGRLGDVTLGFDSDAEYERAGGYLGCVVGRVANRIAGACFALGGETFQLSANEGANHLHGGERGLDRASWELRERSAAHVRLAAVSPDGDQGYPGRLEVRVDYTLCDDDVLRLELEARTDRKTPVNLSHHAYWNLGTPAGGSVLDHVLTSPASHYLPTDDRKLPTGEVAAVAGTAFDFRTGRALGERLSEVTPGYDSHLVLPEAPPGLRFAAELYDPASGRVMALHTTQPGFQLYTGNHLDGTRGKDGVPYGAHRGLCLEPQHPPDAVNQPGFPSVILDPSETYRHTIEWRFSVRDAET